jgi:succinoglycan biosynthesis transport protein ExoP
MQNKELDIRDYWTILSKRIWVVVGVFLLVFGSVLIVTFLTTPVYKATSQIYIDTSGSQFNPQQQPALSQLEKQAFIDTQIGIIKSEAIAREVISKLQLNLAYNDKPKSPLSVANMLNFFGSNNKTRTDEYNLDKTLHKFMESLSVGSVKNTSLVNVSYESDTPELAAKVVNETVQTFINRELAMKVSPAKEYMGWLSDELGKVKGRMDETSNKLESFKRQKNLIVAGEGQSNISLSALSDLNAKVLAAEAKRYDAEIKYQQVLKLSKEPGGAMSLPEVINNKLVQDLKTQQGALAKQIAEQSKKFGEKHPQMVRLNNEMDTVNRQLQGEVDLIVSSLKHDYEDSLKAEQSLRRALERQKSEAMSYARRSSEYELKKQDVEGTKAAYDQVMKKLQESNIMGSMNFSSVRVLDKAVPPTKPIRPKKSQNILLGMLFGIIAGVGFGLVLEHLDNTYRSPENIEEDLGLPFLGVVPNNSGEDGKGSNTIAAVTDPMSPEAEAFRSIRSNLLLSRQDRSPRVIQVVSALRAEGKSTVSVNLACIMAAAGDKVILIDGDMRRPRVHKFFNIKNTLGLSSVLMGKATLDAAITKTSIRDLHFIPSGPIYNSPGDLLGGESMRETMAVLREKYNRVIIDCPPFLGIADSSLMTPLSDGVIVVVRSGKTIKEAVLKITKGMGVIKAEILGVVLNDMERRDLDYYYHYDYTNYVSHETDEG